MILDVCSKRSPFFTAFLEFEVLYDVKIQIAFSGGNSRKIVTIILLHTVYILRLFLAMDNQDLVCSSPKLKTSVKTYVFAL